MVVPVQKGCAVWQIVVGGAGGGGGGVPQPICPTQPPFASKALLVKTKVKQPFVDTTVPGEVFPEYVPITGESVLEPLYIVRKSNPVWVWKAVNAI